MEKKILAVAGLTGSGKRDLIELFRADEDLKKYSEIHLIELSELGNELLKFGGEGYRQVINYFGDDYLKKNGQLNLNKLWKFVYGDQHKLKILDFMFEPLLANKIQQETEGLNGLIIVKGIHFNEAVWRLIISEKIWVKNSTENILKNLENRKLPISASKYFDVQSRLYGLKELDGHYLFNNSDSGQREKEWVALKKALNI